ncbi:MAG: hypothetical protein HY666_03770 [Chloroflexi bacterium]|nr:hypothetical protein [Chloroflexota bacterium]
MPSSSEATVEELLPFHPSWVLIAIFAVLIALGTLILSLPFAVADSNKVSLVDAFFTATSAATGTGLVVQDTAQFWSQRGHAVLLLLFQLGGLASLIGSTFFLLLIARSVKEEERFLFREIMGVQSVRGLILLILGITLYAAIIETAGTLLIGSRLLASYPQDKAWWLAVFHTASAFNNAGFDSMGLGNPLPDPVVQLTLAGLSILGAISFIVIVDMVKGVFARRLSLDTKLVLIATVLLLGGGFGAILLTEWNSPGTLGNLPPDQKLLSAFLHSATARTAGLATANLSAFAYPTLLVLMALMFIGGASGSTAGGIKVNTFALLGAVTWSFIRGRTRISVLGSTVHEDQVYRALAIVFVSTLVIFAAIILLSITEGADLLVQLFEAISAFSTTGFSIGDTANSSTAGKLIIAFVMFAGRVGPLTVAFALSLRSRPSRQTYTQEAINLG